MTRVQFLNDLYRRLGPMSREEAEQHLTYYAEMLADRMEEGMSEEEAVASMEDVDTIAARILQDRAEGSQPPRYPEPPAWGESGETAAEEERPRKRWRWLEIAAVTVGVLALLWYVVPGVLFAVHRGEQVEAATVVEVGEGDGDVEFITILENDTAVPTEFAPAVGMVGSGSISTQGIRDLHIIWTAGAVRVETWDGAEITFTEEASALLEPDTALFYDVRDQELTIRFSQDLRGGFHGEKDLTVLVPEDMVFNELEIDNTAGPVEVAGISGGELSVSVTSDDCTVLGGSFQEISIDTVSGDAFLEGVSRSVDFESVSGDLELMLPEDAGFSLSLETVSGTLDAGAFPVRRGQGEQYICGAGGLEIEAETVSGGVKLHSW